MKLGKALLSIGIGFLLAAPVSASPAAYSIGSFTDLGRGTAVSVNNSGVVAGHDDLFAYTWKNGNFNRFGSAWTETSKAVAINENGTVLGKDTGSGRNFTYTPGTGVVYSDVKMTATDINNSGKFVGYRRVNGVRESILVDGTGNHTILSGIDRAYGINDSDQIAGFNYKGPNPGEKQRAVLYNQGNITHLGTLGGYEHRDMSFGQGLNNKGDVFGYSWHPDGIMTAFAWENGTDPGNLQKIPYMDGVPNGRNYMYAMNDHGWLAGKSRNEDDPDKKWEGVLFDGKNLIRLNDFLGPDFVVGGDKWINNVKGISENGWIVGTFKQNGGEHAFAMKLNTVPVPGALWLLGSGLLGLAGLRRKMK